MSRPAEQSGAPGETPVRDAACLILMDRSAGEPRLLMGRRLPDQAFLPNKWVFPGGRVDDADRAAFQSTAPDGDGVAGGNGHYAFAHAAIRETFEETGILVSAAISGAAGSPSSAVAAADALRHLRPIARAITPPAFPRRFDTWFYLTPWDRTRPATGAPDGELLDMGWFTLADLRTLDLPLITRLIAEDVARELMRPETAGPGLVPFYFEADGSFQRTLIDPAWPLRRQGAEG